MSDASRSTIFLLPGLAADRALFEPQLRAFPNLRVPEWIAPASEGEPIEDYARRMARTLALPESGPYWIGGFSFGGQVAQEMVAHLPRRPAGVVLICGVRSRTQLTPRFHAQQFFGGLIPHAVQRRLYGPFARLFARQCGLDAAQTQALVQMAQRNDPAFLTWSARACARWRCNPNLVHPAGGSPVRVHHIHGALDPIIPDADARADQLIPNAGHLITWTHAAEVNAFLEAVTNDA